jgi:hypothetical protein
MGVSAGASPGVATAVGVGDVAASASSNPGIAGHPTPRLQARRNQSRKLLRDLPRTDQDGLPGRAWAPRAAPRDGERFDRRLIQPLPSGVADSHLRWRMLIVLLQQRRQHFSNHLVAMATIRRVEHNRVHPGACPCTGGAPCPKSKNSKDQPGNKPRSIFLIETSTSLVTTSLLVRYKAAGKVRFILGTRNRASTHVSTWSPAIRRLNSCPRRSIRTTFHSLRPAPKAQHGVLAHR